ncbi:MAG TPA: metalloregulator ArsR/SmtB family transcription factor [Aggregatilineales bacterium]|nr:winged helix-turn-helix transcriptional regulator [Anaerolineales bacterium]HRE46157.1 metalloregulator ArsR/SmtB family transcription factor [Aggregatilineales bacterium]
MTDRIDAAIVLAPQVVTVDFDLAPTLNIVDSMVSLIRVEHQASFSEWVVKTAAAFSPEQRYTHKLIFWGLANLFYETDPRAFPNFPAFLDHWRTLDPVTMRDDLVAKIISYQAKLADMGIDATPPTAEALIADRAVYLDWVRHFYQEEEMDVAYETDLHALLANPQKMHKLMVDHMTLMWETVMRPEWERVEPSLRATISAFEKLDFTGMTAQEAIRVVTGREVPFKWGDKLNHVERITFIPSPHLGPFLVIFASQDPHVRILFGARMPKENLTPPSALGRSELLVRLNALADDTRLRILELLTQEQEICAQDIISRLDLSQSSASRHLSQLAATGYITERRRDVAKCYSLNGERIEETNSALAAFLRRRY